MHPCARARRAALRSSRTVCVAAVARAGRATEAAQASVAARSARCRRCHGFRPRGRRHAPPACRRIRCVATPCFVGEGATGRVRDCACASAGSHGQVDRQGVDEASAVAPAVGQVALGVRGVTWHHGSDSGRWTRLARGKRCPKISLLCLAPPERHAHRALRCSTHPSLLCFFRRAWLTTRLRSTSYGQKQSAASLRKSLPHSHASWQGDESMHRWGEHWSHCVIQSYIHVCV